MLQEGRNLSSLIFVRSSVFLPHRRFLLPLALLVVCVSSCAGSSPSAYVTSGRWVFDGLVLERPESGRGPIACFGDVAGSLPPAACGGWPLKGWDWATAPQASEGAGVRTSYARLVGHVEGDSFVLTEPPRPLIQGETTYGCTVIGRTDEPSIAPGSVNARLDTPEAQAAGLFPTSPHSFRVSSGGDPAATGVIGLRLLADTPKVRALLRKEFGDVLIGVCAVLQPENGTTR